MFQDVAFAVSAGAVVVVVEDGALVDSSIWRINCRAGWLDIHPRAIVVAAACIVLLLVEFVRGLQIRITEHGISEWERPLLSDCRSRNSCKDVWALRGAEESSGPNAPSGFPYASSPRSMICCSDAPYLVKNWDKSGSIVCVELAGVSGLLAG